MMNEENIQMTNDKSINEADAASWTFWFRVSFVLRHLSFVICFGLLLLIVTQVSRHAVAQGQIMNVTGRWNVEINFADGNKRSLRFDAQENGKGTFLLLDPMMSRWGSAKPSEAKWIPGDQNSVTFSGTVEFPIGNVGRDPGTLMLKGKFETPGTISGDVEFAPLIGERPSKHGTFKAVKE
jgi:hypothetical protein